MNEICQKVQVKEPLPKRREGERGGRGEGGTPDYPEKNLTSSSKKNRYDINMYIKGENSPPRLGIEPSTSNNGNKFAWPERAGSNPLNYCLPLEG